jgi:HPt (histidine-containing phosphotransfer) domain-containing protein
MTTRLLNLEIIASVSRQLPDAAASSKFWIESLTLSQESLTNSLDRFDLALKSKNSQELAHAVHKLCGTIGFVGATVLCDRLLAIQEECESNQIIWPLHDESQIRETVHQVIRELKLAVLTPPT